MLISEIDHRLLFPFLHASNWEEALDLITDKMIQCGYVYPTYKEAVKQREREYPTGFKVIGGIGAAVPHAEPGHVIRPVTAVASLREPVLFKDMEGGETKISLIFLQAILNPSDHIDTMSEIVMLLRDTGNVKALLSAAGPQQMLSVLENFESRYKGIL